MGIRPHLPLFTLLHPERLFLFVCFPDEKVFKGKYFAVWKSERKPAEALKVVKIDKFKNCFEQWKKSLDRCVVSNRE